MSGDVAAQGLLTLFPCIQAFQAGVHRDFIPFLVLQTPKQHNPFNNFALDHPKFEKLNAALTPWLDEYGLSRLPTLFKAMSFMKQNVLLHAVYEGHLHLVEHLDDHFDLLQAFGLNLIDIAASRGNMPLVVYLHERGHPGCTKVAMGGAAQNGHLDVVKFLHSHRQEGCYRGALETATLGGHLEVVEWLCGNKIDPCTDVAAKFAVESGHLAIYEFLLDHGAYEPRDLLDGKVFAKHMSDDLTTAAHHGYIEMARYLRDVMNAQWTSQAFDDAASQGHLDLLVEMSTSDVHGSDRALEGAAGNGHVHVVEWLLERQVGLEAQNAINRAAQNGHLDILERLFNHGFRHCTAASFDRAAGGGHLQVLKWLHDKLHQTGTPRSVGAAVARGSLEVVQWLVAQFYPDHIVNLDTAAANGHLETMQWLHEHHVVSCSHRAMDFAATNGNLEVVQWLHLHRTEGCTTAAMDSAAAGGFLAVVKYLHYHRHEGCTAYAMDAAARKGYLHVVTFLSENRTEGCSSKALEGAVEIGHVDLVRFLLRHHPNETANLLDIAAAHGNLEIIQLLHEEKNASCSIAALDGAAKNGWLAVVRFLLDHRTEGCSFRALQETLSIPVLELLVKRMTWTLANFGNLMLFGATHGYLNVVEWAYSHGGDECRASAHVMDAAAEYGHLHVLQWLQGHRNDGCSTRAMDRAARKGYTEIVEWLYANRYEQCTIAAFGDTAFRGDVRMLAWLCNHMQSHEGELKALDVATAYSQPHILAYLETRGVSKQ
ncbi:unnamed protein product [Aphanomyces euteiches]|uniref:Uncharacterized protein n=1 Tax=Aphanomyces euteiches TaxID=100861 RepID=A0A6G0XW47_9STRA|nr:hypothetical protein Ae201684_001146 [Aphanomyces euteiches]KAH9099641.1 hypothetical protein Ae201684P_018654 [Aphanomyces euteiches]KAH9152261.1 hypothetical protein AeRB84_005272 [Aphanomyces euteiches]